jgi:tetratricopeptide (TPR) repeat protein
MKNLKVQFKLIIYLFLFLSIPNVILAKNLDKFSNAEDISSYFSGILSINDNQYQKSYSYLKSLNNLEDVHYTYSQYYLFSLVTLNKLKAAAKYSKKLEEKKIDNFESNIVNAIYHLEDKDYKKTLFYLKKLENKNQPGSIQNLLFTSMNAWVNFKGTSNLNIALNHLDSIPKKFKNLTNIQKTFAYCYFDSPKTSQMFEQLTSNSDVNYSRYLFFHSN